LVCIQYLPVGNTASGWTVLTPQRNNETVVLLRDNSTVHAVQ